MTFLLFAFGVFLVGYTVRLIVYAVVLPRIRISAHLRSVHGYGFESRIEAGYERPHASERVDHAAG